MTHSFNTQDTIKHIIVVAEDSLKQKPDSNFQNLEIQKQEADSTPLVSETPLITSPVYRKAYKPVIETAGTDTTSVCGRNPVSDITFHDSLNYIIDKKLAKTDPFPFVFIEKTRTIDQEYRAGLIKHLKEGESIPDRPLHGDWLLAIFVTSAFIYFLIRTISSDILNEATRFFFFRGINDPASRDTGGLFSWQATLLNLATFLNLGLFVLYAAIWYDLIPEGTSELLAWAISTGIIIIAVTLRHLAVILTGNFSDQKEIFREYLLGIYHSYRLSGIIVFIIVILISYTNFVPVKLLIRSGLFFLILMYCVRVLRLFLIFINRNVSIFYLILYLCALEILPVLILLKYFAGLF